MKNWSKGVGLGGMDGMEKTGVYRKQNWKDSVTGRIFQVEEEGRCEGCFRILA
jgi:hypothetical protein